MIGKFNDFKYDFILENLLLESQIQFSDRFVQLVNQLKRNKIAKDILSIIKDKKDEDYTQNYIDLGKEKDELTFTPERKVKEFFGKEAITKFKVTKGDRYLVNKPINQNIFDKLGYSYKEDTEAYSPPVGTIGTIKAECISAKGTQYVWFVSENGETVLNKQAIVPYDERQVKIWSRYRSNIKIGRLVRAILTTSKIQFTDKDIESFVNDYKAAYDILSNAFLKFSLVTGRDISYWYDMERYQTRESTLGNSCMAEVNDDYFDIYTENKNCSLLILFSENGTITDGKYKSKTICGRALIWTTEQGDIFMDRIYTNFDSDVSLFRRYAHENGWWCKSAQTSSYDFNATNGVISKPALYTVKLEKSIFDHYPYFDTLGYINIDNKIISNSASEIDASGEMDSTQGNYQRFR